MNKIEKQLDLKTQTIYIVTVGNYSDYRIVAVFTNEQLAEEFVTSKNFFH